VALWWRRAAGAHGPEARGEGDAVGVVAARGAADVAAAHPRGGDAVLQHQEAERRAAAQRRQGGGRGPPLSRTTRHFNSGNVCAFNTTFKGDVSVISRSKRFQKPVGTPPLDITSGRVHRELWWLDQPTSCCSPLGGLVG